MNTFLTAWSFTVCFDGSEFHTEIMFFFANFVVGDQSLPMIVPPLPPLVENLPVDCEVVRRRGTQYLHFVQLCNFVGGEHRRNDEVVLCFSRKGIFEWAFVEPCNRHRHKDPVVVLHVLDAVIPHMVLVRACE